MTSEHSSNRAPRRARFLWALTIITIAAAATAVAIGTSPASASSSATPRDPDR